MNTAFLVYSEDTGLLHSSPTFDFYNLATLSATTVTELWDVCETNVLFVAEHSPDTHSLYFDKFYISVLITVQCTKKPLT